MSIIKELAARFAPASVPTGKDDVSRAVTPVYDEKHIEQLTRTIREEAPEWLSLWFDISIESGGRTADIASLRFSNVDYATGELRYTVAKQSKAARARAVRKGLIAVRDERMKAATDAEYRQLASMPLEELALTLSATEEEIVAAAVAKAKAKTDSKFLSPALTARIQKFQDKGLAESTDFIFPASVTGANRSQGMDDKPVSRQTIWRRIKPFMQRIEQLVTDMKLHLSAYSTRKICAFLFMKRGDQEHPGSGIGLAMEALGHSSIAMTRRYLGLDKLGAALQRKMARQAA